MTLRNLPPKNCKHKEPCRTAAWHDTNARLPHLVTGQSDYDVGDDVIRTAFPKGGVRDGIGTVGLQEVRALGELCGCDGGRGDTCRSQEAAQHRRRTGYAAAVSNRLPIDISHVRQRCCLAPERQRVPMRNPLSPQKHATRKKRDPAQHAADLCRHSVAKTFSSSLS